jgi:hypothetical protein
MKSRVCFVFLVFFFTAVLIFTVWVRTANDRICYRLCVIEVEQSRLKQELWQKQLRVESMINPAAMSDRFEQ